MPLLFSDTREARLRRRPRPSLRPDTKCTRTFLVERLIGIFSRHMPAVRRSCLSIGRSSTSRFRRLVRPSFECTANSPKRAQPETRTCEQSRFFAAHLIPRFPPSVLRFFFSFHLLRDLPAVAPILFPWRMKCFCTYFSSSRSSDRLCGTFFCEGMGALMTRSRMRHRLG